MGVQGSFLDAVMSRKLKNDGVNTANTRRALPADGTSLKIRRHEEVVRLCEMGLEQISINSEGVFQVKLTKGHCTPCQRT